MDKGKKVIKNNRKIRMKYNKQQQQQQQQNNSNNNKVNVPELNCKIQQKRLKQKLRKQNVPRIQYKNKKENKNKNNTKLRNKKPKIQEEKLLLQQLWLLVKLIYTRRKWEVLTTTKTKASQV